MNCFRLRWLALLVMPIPLAGVIPAKVIGNQLQRTVERAAVQPLDGRESIAVVLRKH